MHCRAYFVHLRPLCRPLFLSAFCPAYNITVVQKQLCHDIPNIYVTLMCELIIVLATQNAGLHVTQVCM